MYNVTGIYLTNSSEEMLNSAKQSLITPTYRYNQDPGYIEVQGYDGCVDCWR